MIHVISLTVENHQGVVARIAGLFYGRGYNLESITAGKTTDPSVSRITLVCKGEDAVIDQIKKQLNRLIDVIKVVDLTAKRTVDRELALFKITTKPERRAEIFQVAGVLNAKIMDIGWNTLVLELTGSSQKIDDALALLQEYGIKEFARGGLVSLERGAKQRKQPEKTAG